MSSWKVLNPDFEVVLLDDSNLRDYFGSDGEIENWRKFPLQKQSDVLRLSLLHRHGGYWADATLFCATPLSDWLDTAPQSGVVLIRTKKRKNRFLQSFFIGSVPQSHALFAWLIELTRILSNAPSMTKGTQKRWKRRFPILWSNSLMTSIWSLLPIVKKTGYPYLVPHYIANRLIFFNPRFRKAFLHSEHYLAGEALHLSTLENGSDVFRNQLNDNCFPIWKLSWRTFVTPDYWTSVIETCRAYLSENSSKGI